MIARGLICSGVAFAITFILYPRFGRRVSLVAGWATGALLVWATAGGK